jgi:hypothetical protein
MTTVTPIKKNQQTPEPLEHIEHFFLDSGAHSLYTKEVIKKKGTKEYQGFAYFESDDFWKYVDTYAAFVKGHLDAIDFYVNVDIIFNPELSWKVLKHLENTHGLKPLPVIHHGTDLKWIKKHVEAGYDFIGLGGLGQEVTKQQYYAWADQVYSYLCPPPKRIPIVKTHGFAMTAYDLLLRYPWWSVDSASWVKAGGFGIVYVPRKRGGIFTFDVEPFNISVSNDSPSKKERHRHIFTLTNEEAKLIKEWLEEIDVPYGKVDKEGKMVEWGVISHHGARKIANLRFFQALTASLPKWPWPFKGVFRQGFF